MPPPAFTNRFNHSLIMAFTQPSGLPKGWIKGVAGDYGTYYCHPASGITQWQHPSEPVLSYSLEPADLLEDDGPYASDSMEQGELTDEDEPMDDTAPAMVTSSEYPDPTTSPFFNHHHHHSDPSPRNLPELQRQSQTRKPMLHRLYLPNRRFPTRNLSRLSNSDEARVDKRLLPSL